jgi:predicted esterase
MKEHKIQVSRTAHYYTLGEPGPDIEELWIACHGYAQLATSLLGKFESVDNGSRLIVAPEGLSRFYWNGFSGKVVASWMTSRDRLDEIEDYSFYLSHLYEHFRSRLSPDVRVFFFGFSQGCATLCRWMLKAFPDFDHLILWGGFLPEDLDYKAHASYLAQAKIHFVYGLQDEFLSPERLKKAQSFLEEQQLEANMFSFNGRHTVEPGVLEKLIANIGVD